MADMSDRDTSARSGGYSGAGGQDSPSESRGGPGSGAGSSSSKGSSSSGGGASSSKGGGGLNSAGNRASGAGPGASGNKSTTGGGYSGKSGNTNGGGMGGGLNSAGNRASGAGPGASGNRSTTGGGYGGTSGLGGQGSPRGMSNSSIGGGMASGMTDSARRADMAQAARASENASMSTYNAARSLSQANASRADLTQQARTAETQSMNDMADWGKEVKSVVAAGPGWTSVELNNGQIETRKGDRASRNNNPGNIEAGDFAKKHGAVGTDGRFAVFSNKEDGIKAIGALLGTSRYTSKTVEGAISSYAPPSENNTAAYASTVASKIGVSKDTPMSSLTTAQRTAMAHAIMGVEGNTGYTKTTTGTDRFSSTYMGGKTASTTASTAERNAATTQEAAKAQQNDPSGLPPGTYRGYDPSGLPPEKPATTAPAPAQPRSLGQKVAAGAIDIGLGMLPGVGTAVSVVNGGLALTGNRTLGERAVDSFVNGEGGPGSDSGADRQGGSGRDQVVKNTSTVPKQAESFEDRYLAFVDKTPRPTPAQKWNYDTPGYA